MPAGQRPSASSPGAIRQKNWVRRHQQKNLMRSAIMVNKTAKFPQLRASPHDQPPKESSVFTCAEPACNFTLMRISYPELPWFPSQPGQPELRGQSFAPPGRGKPEPLNMAKAQLGVEVRKVLRCQMRLAAHSCHKSLRSSSRSNQPRDGRSPTNQGPNSTSATCRFVSRLVPFVGASQLEAIACTRTA